MEDAGHTANTLPKETTGVIVGNSLTGERTRANLLRLRWPYARRALRAAIRAQGRETPPREEAQRGLVTTSLLGHDPKTPLVFPIRLGALYAEPR